MDSVEANIGRSSAKVLTEHAALVGADWGSGLWTKAGAVAESPLSPLHPVLLLNAYLGWTWLLIIFAFL